MTPDDPRRTCIFGHARKRNSNFRFGKVKHLSLYEGEKKIGPCIKGG